MATLGDIILDVETNLSMMGGIDVQTYGQPRIVLAINQAFVQIFEMRFWKRHRTYAQRTIDPTTGFTTTTFPVARYTDIQFMWADQAPKPLMELPSNVNPNAVTIRGFMPDAANVVRILPIGRIGGIDILYRSRPTGRFVEDDEVPFDEIALCYKACILLTVSDGANMALAKMFESMLKDRMNTLEKAEMTDRAFGPTYAAWDGDSAGWSNGGTGLVNLPDFIILDENAP